MVIIRGKEVHIDLNHTVYDSLKLPENDDEIYERVKYIRDELEKGTIRDNGGLIAHYVGEYIKGIDTSLKEYEKTKDITTLLCTYSWIDLSMKQAFLKDKEKAGEISNKELHDFMTQYRFKWSILSNPEHRRDYDHELDILRRIQAIENKHERERVLRNKIVREEMLEKEGTDSFDKSHFGGARIRDQFGKIPTYSWGIKEYQGGKRLIFATQTRYQNRPELNQRVEVYAHGEFLWGSMLRKDADGIIRPTFENPLCEVISVRKIDKDGNEDITYGIAQTRDLGHFDKMTEAEIRENERKGIEVILLSTPEEIQEREFLIRQEERRRRRPQQAYKVVRVTKPTDFGEKLVRFNRVLDRIGMEIPNMFIPKETIEKRIPIAGATESIKEFVPRAQRDYNKKYNVLVMVPERYKMRPDEQSEYARTRLADFRLEEDKLKNGHFFGLLGSKTDLTVDRLLDETIKVCQYATVNPGYIIASGRTDRTFSSANIGEALDYIARRDKARSEQARRSLQQKDDYIFGE